MANVAETPKSIDHPVQFFADDWNSSLYRHRLMILPTYCDGHLIEVRVNLVSGRYNTDDYQWHELLAKGEKALPIYASLENERTDFTRGMINLRVNSASPSYREEAIAEWLSWLTAVFLPTIERR